MIDIDSLNKAIALANEGRIKEAEDIYKKLVDENPENSILMSAFGLFYVNIQDYDNAVVYLKKACEIKESLGTLSALGFAEYERGEYLRAARILVHALKFGENLEIYNTLILSFFRIEDYPVALEYATKMFQKYPKNIDAVSHIIKALTHTGKMLEAERLCIEYLKENQNLPSLWLRLGFLKELIYSDDLQACQCYEQALNLGEKDAYYNMAVSYQKQGDFKKAEEYYTKMLEYRPNSTEAKSSFGMCKLAQKKFKDGYELFFQRAKKDLERDLKKPWNINESWAENVQVICDQGLGDHIQFVRYLPFLKEKTKSIQVVTNKALIGLFQKNYPEIDFITYEDIDYNMQTVRITDLAYALDINFDNIPFSEGYLKSESANIENKKLKVGLCWEAGSAGIRGMINRTINVKFFEPFMNLAHVQTYSFQVKDSLKGNEKYSEKMINLASDFKDFSDTAKAIKAMDLIITVDTSVAHLAGALGIKTFLMLPYASDWRWFSDTKTTPWYKSIEIFKQTDTISWEKPIEDIICKLKEYSL